MRWALIFVVIYTCVSLALARKKYKAHTHPPEAGKGDNATGPTSLDLRGNLRQHFFTITALSDTKENLVCSPLSALMPLGKLALGAVGNSLKEILSAIGVSTKREIERHFKPLIAEMRYLPGVNLNVASRLYVLKNIRLNRDFRDAAKEIFISSVEKVDFNKPKQAAATINNWVAKETSQKIRDLIDPGQLSSATSMAIVNAVYFKGNWLEPFDNDGIKIFHSPTGKKNVTMMSKQSTFSYSRSKALNAELVKIPYVGGKAYFLVVLPEEQDSLPQLLKRLKESPDMLDMAINKMERKGLQLTMPIFKTRSRLDLGSFYKEMGVKKMFQKDSGLDEMVRNQTISVSTAMHKAYIEVNEKGTEAAAASATILIKLAYKTLQFHANRPFLYFVIVEKQQLFSGVFVTP